MFFKYILSLFSAQPAQAQEQRSSIDPAVELIKQFEGFRNKAYLDPVGILTIGYGRTKNVKVGEVTTVERELQYLMQDITEIRIPAIMDCIEVPITNNELNALISFVYNVGVGAFSSCTMTRKLNAGYPRQEVAEEFDRWVYGGGKILKGLVKRRKAEKQLFLTPDLP